MTNMESIGNIIAKLRKEGDITQEELARAIGVSAQAVSKWENGGIPDTGLLPKIADYFSISIDTLFGRNITDYSDLQSALTQKIQEAESSKMEEAFEWCWVVNQASGGLKENSVKDMMASQEENEESEYIISNKDGFTRMNLSKRLRYFLMVPEPEDRGKAFFEGYDYTELFRDLSDPLFFQALAFFHKRQKGKAFTVNLLTKNLNMDAEEALAAIKLLDKYKMVQTKQMEMDDTIQEIYTFEYSQPFIAMLIFAQKLIGRNAGTEERDKSCTQTSIVNMVIEGD